MSGEDEATLQEWFDLARRPWAADFRIEREVPRMGLKNAVAWLEDTEASRGYLQALLERVTSAQPQLRERALDAAAMGLVPSDCAF